MKIKVYPFILFLFVAVTSLTVLFACGNSKKSMGKVTDFSAHPSEKEADFSMVAPDSSWKVSFTSGKELIFTDLTQKEQFKIAKPEEQLAAGANILNVFGTQNGVQLRLVIDVSPCKSGGLKSSITYNEKTLEGCGFYLGHADLFTNWEPLELNGKPIKNDFFKNKQPILTFNHEEGTISGNGGCNTFTGKVSYNYKSFTTEGLISTKMFCEPESKFENVLIQILGGKKVHYSFKENNQLLLIETTEGSILYKKIQQL